MTIKVQTVVRKIQLSQPDSIAAACEILRQQDAVVAVWEDKPKQSVEVEYDQGKTGYLLLLTRLQQQGIEVQKGWLGRFKSQWFDYIDTTVRENAAVPPAACCNKPPKKL
jgi:hypothetical protein